MITHLQDCDVPGELMVSEPYFVLVQDNEPVDSSQHPAALIWSALDDDKDFKVAIGVIDGDGHKEIIGICAEYIAGEGEIFYLTSDMDGWMRTINRADDSVEVIRSRLCQLFNMKRFSDPFNFTKVRLYKGGVMGTPK